MPSPSAKTLLTREFDLVIALDFIILGLKCVITRVDGVCLFIYFGSYYCSTLDDDSVM